MPAGCSGSKKDKERINRPNQARKCNVGQVFGMTLINGVEL